MTRERVPAGRRAALIAVVTVSVAYAPIAMTGLWPYADENAPAIGETLLAAMVSSSCVADAPPRTRPGT